MVGLTEPQKREIVEGLAEFKSSAAMIDHFRLNHSLELTHKQIGRYDPTRPYFDAGERWRAEFRERRKTYLENISEVPIAHKVHRLKFLQEGVDAARSARNWVLMAKLLRQAAREVGGVFTAKKAVSVDPDYIAPRDMTPEHRKMALAAIIQTAQDEFRCREGSMRSQ